ncbi:MAG: nucleotidyltransferase domain-containing protein [Planctomycetota bacterium]|nr:nucleotidyltransferase domain-containing protein [Planctomycetota bacterium]
MISSQDKFRILELARQFRATRVLLFGSSADPAKEGRDIDLAVEGVAPSRFFEFCGRLIVSLSKPVDVLDLGVKTRFADIVRREGVPLHE